MKEKGRIMLVFLGGFVMPPVVWLISLWYYDIVSWGELLQIAISPFLWIYVGSYIVGLFFLLRKFLGEIDRYVVTKDAQHLEVAQKRTAFLPKFFILAEIIYCAIGPNTGMLGKDFLTGDEYLYGLLTAVPIIILFSIPFLTGMTTILERDTRSIPLSKKHKSISLRIKMIMNMVVTTAGLASLIILFNYIKLHIAESSGVALDLEQLLMDNLFLGIASVLVTVVNFFTISRQMVAPIRRISDQLFEMSRGKGDLSEDLHVTSRDEIGKLGTNFNAFLEALRGIIKNLREISSSSQNIGSNLAANSEELSAALEEIAATINAYNEKTKLLNDEVNKSNNAAVDIKEKIGNVDDKIDNQAVSVNEASAAIEQMIASVKSVTDIAQQKNEHIAHLLQIGADGKENMNKTIQAIGKITESADVISQLINVINDIAEQTNLLAMNASIEAAHAGDSGRGFSVVAKEIRKLAGSARNNSKNVSQSLQDIIEKIKEADSLTRDTGDSIKTILSDIDSVSHGMNEVVNAMNEMSEGSKQIMDSTADLISITSDVKHSSSIMNENADFIEKSMESLTLLSRENTDGIAQISSGVNEITHSIVMVSELGADNSKNIDSLEGEIGKFVIEKQQAFVGVQELENA